MSDRSHERWTAAQVAATSSDQRVLSAARALSVTPGVWSEEGCDDAAVWGRCQGTARRPYDVVVELARPAFACSCPSTKAPCKHAAALLLRWARWDVGGGPRPAWAGTAPQPRQRPAATAPKDPEAAAARAARRTGRIMAGGSELARWLDDLARTGLGALRHAEPEVAETVAARMVDAQAPGLGARVRSLAWLARSGAPADVLAGEAARLWLLARAAGRLADLDGPVAADVRSLAGWPLPHEEVAARGERVADRWTVAAQRTELEEHYVEQRSWLVGQRSSRVALVLDFASGDRPIAVPLRAGTQLEATLAFWPGAWPERALVLEPGEATPSTAPAGGTLDEACARLAAALAADPLRSRVPVVVAGARSGRRGDGWGAVDPSGAVELAVDDARGWRLLAATGGHPATLVGEWDGRALTPVAVWPAPDRLVGL